MIEPHEDRDEHEAESDPGTESVVEIDPSEVEAFLERVGTLGAHEDESEIDDEDDAPPVIPGYEVVGVVGRGATGIVYRALQAAVDRPVALKVLHRELITNRRAVRRLQREARLAAKLAHPSIISAIDMGEIDGLWWYAMELVEGVPLSRRIAERGSLTEREILRLFSPLCDALQHSHEVGVVHRDIKPANILIDRRGRARLVDLGLAMGQNDPSITRTGSTLGTPHYVSPEQARDPSQADIRSDIWSVGATMYHAACGRPPFHADREEDGGVAEILSRVLYEPVVDPREFAPSLSKDFSLLLRKCLTRDPLQRYQEPWELVADIELLRERRRLDLRGSQLDPYASRRPPWVGRAVAVSVMAVAIGATWAITARPWEERPSNVVIQRAAELGDWPELAAIDVGFEAEELSHAAALAELESPAMLALPEAAKFLHSDLVVRIKGDLDKAVRASLGASENEVTRALEEHSFERAVAAVEVGVDERIRGRTGFALIDELPEGAIRLRAMNWRRDQRSRVDEAHDGARRAALNGLQRAYPRAIRGRIDALLESNRWADAWAVLAPSAPLSWLELEGAEVDLRGLSMADKLEIARVVEAAVDSDRSDVRYRVSRAVDDASDFIGAERQSLIDEINDGQITGESTAAARFAAALEAKHASLGLSLAQLPPDFEADYRDKIDAVLRELEQEEGKQRETLARLGVNELERAARPLLLERRYDDVRKLYRAAREEDWRSSTFDTLDARLREIDLLDEVLARAVAGVRAADRKTVELTFRRIPESGRVDANGDATDRLGFSLRRERSSAIRIVLWPSQLTGARDEELLEADDVLRFAALWDEANLGPADQLAAAAFLSAEGRPEDARRRIRLQDYSPEDRLPADLETRVRRRADAARSESESDASGRSAQRAEVRDAAAPAATFKQAFGVPNQTDLGRRARLVWRFADGVIDPAADDLPRALPVGETRRGAWGARGWSLEPTGYSLGEGLRERADLLSGDLGPHLALVEPLRADRPIEVAFQFIPGDHRPDGHVVGVSIRGYHVLLVSDRFEPLVWFGTGDLKALLEHALDDAEEAPDGFTARPFAGLRDDEVSTIEVELGAGSLERLVVDGKRLQFPRFSDEPRLTDPHIRFRSDKPLTLLSAEVRGERVPLR